MDTLNQIILGTKIVNVAFLLFSLAIIGSVVYLVVGYILRRTIYNISKNERTIKENEMKFNKSYLKSLGRTIRTKRHKQNKSLSTLAQQIKVSAPTLCHIENGTMPRLNTYLKIHTWLWD